jgi:hypothetical protein
MIQLQSEPDEGTMLIKFLLLGMTLWTCHLSPDPISNGGQFLTTEELKP